ncbi:hypothetical protein BCR32DRAFT_269125 [Anaeromyces robustus]|uniref:Uncharacterized protein n=1 Tax=Anaeromyces robustus TaxID=1754192 RepID=A0A1Y1X2H7_9FUNG|nr:hypothetical protein BCR32DRAFT_269125 [Anaeromyces robustus]|eukprot:ORX80009.1 hypothetical protein BCR32DRAFT_269125 [Anaeromyces robustus]
MDSKRSNKVKKSSKKSYGRDHEWEQRIMKERKAQNDYDSKWGFMKEKQRTDALSNKLTDVGPVSQYPVTRKSTMKVGEKEYDVSRLYPLNKNKGKDVTFSTHNFSNFDQKQESLPGQPIYHNSNRLRYQLKIKPGLPQEIYDYPICGNMEYGWNWTGRDIDGMFGSLNVNPVNLAMNRWKQEKKN